MSLITQNLWFESKDGPSTCSGASVQISGTTGLWAILACFVVGPLASQREE